MNIIHMVKQWVNYHEEKQHKYGTIVLVLLGLAFVLADWSLYYFSFAEFIIMAILPILFVVGQLRLSKCQIQTISLIIGLIVFHAFLRDFLNIEPYFYRTTLQASIKLIFYLFVVTFFYNYIKRNSFEERFLIINNILAILVITVGLYIVFSIYNNHEYPYRFFWSFTRDDYRSYYFSGNSDFIRMRSIFSEPAHLGHYLLIVLTANLSFFKVTLKNVPIIIILCLGVFLTFSYSMVITLFIILSIFLLKNNNIGNLNKVYLLISILTISVVLFIFRDYIYETFIQRTINIISGTDGSAYIRLVQSWMYVERDKWWIGNGINHTPVITNNFAYMLSDLGLFGLIPFIILNVWIFKNSVILGTLFLMLNISRGSYLGPSFWFLLLFILIYMNGKKDTDIKNARRSPHEKIERV
ncbi:hypothetical protein IRB23M11_07560 [Alkalibacterium sp. m-11]|uniref:O-antigen ligase like membrane protein n=2 Tax=Alkalibacterium indicireducens TaxID=398758 RepID=A0ABP3KPR6_9LACT